MTVGSGTKVHYRKEEKKRAFKSICIRKKLIVKYTELRFHFQKFKFMYIKSN